jgi:probable rRNA maturation factor
VSLQVVVNREGLRVPVASARLGDAVMRVLRSHTVRAAMVSVTLMPPRQMAALNRKHLGHSGPTDIITFGFRDPAGVVLGDVYICPAVARTNARAFGVPFREELLRLAVHGALHVLGHTHPEGEARTRSPMWRRQEQLLRRVLAA